MNFIKWVLIIVIPLSIFLLILQKIVQGSIAKEIKNALNHIPGFNPSLYYCSVYGTGVGVDVERKLVVFYDTLKKSTQKCNYADIIGCEVFVDGNSVSKTNRGSQAIGAAVGGVLLGPAGFLVGALSGSSRQVEKIKKVSVKLQIKDISNPFMELIFYQGNEVKKNSIIIQPQMQEVDEWVARFHAIMAEG